MRGFKKLQKIFEGNRGEIFLLDYYGKRAVLKKLRPNRPNTLQKEARILRFLEPLKIAPKVYESGDDYIVMEYLQGVSLKEMARNKDTLKEALKVCYLLDRLGIYHRELGRYYHFVFTKEGVRVLDFERAVYRAHPRNVLQFVGFYLRAIDTKEAVELYKQSPREGLKKLFEVLDVL